LVLPHLQAEATVRENLERALSDEYIVDTAGDGREALKAVLQASPTLIVSGCAIDEQRIEGF
jgi:hypothetical protein